MRLQHRIAIVTGAGSGFGRGIATRFAAEGARVVVNDVNEAHGAETVAAIRAAGGSAALCIADVSKDADVARLVRCALEAFGGLHVVVNNAGAIRRNVRLHEVGVERWDEQIASNLRGPYLVTHAALPELLRAEGDRAIVNVASTLAVKPVPGEQVTDNNEADFTVIFTR